MLENPIFYDLSGGGGGSGPPVPPSGSAHVTTQKRILKCYIIIFVSCAKGPDVAAIRYQEKENMSCKP